MVEAVKPKDISPEQAEREVARRYQVLQQESQALVQRLVELEDEKKENM